MDAGRECVSNVPSGRRNLLVEGTYSVEVAFGGLRISARSLVSSSVKLPSMVNCRVVASRTIGAATTRSSTRMARQRPVLSPVSPSAARQFARVGRGERPVAAKQLAQVEPVDVFHDQHGRVVDFARVERPHDVRMMPWAHGQFKRNSRFCFNHPFKRGDNFD